VRVRRFELWIGAEMDMDGPLHINNVVVDVDKEEAAALALAITQDVLLIELEVVVVVVISLGHCIFAFVGTKHHLR
jgi:hypothetical protein